MMYERQKIWASKLKQKIAYESIKQKITLPTITNRSGLKRRNSETSLTKNSVLKSIKSAEFLSDMINFDENKLKKL